MEKLLESLVTASPATAAAVIVVFMFLKYLRDTKKEGEEQQKHNARVIERNSEVIGENTSVHRETMQALREFNKHQTKSRL